MEYFNSSNTENTIVKDHTDDQTEVTRLETIEKIDSQDENFDDCLKGVQVEKVSEAPEETEENFDDVGKDTNQYEKIAEAAEEDSFDTSDLKKDVNMSEIEENGEEPFDDFVEDTDQKQVETSDTVEDTSDGGDDTSDTDTGDARDLYKEIKQDQMEETPETEEKTDESSEDIKEENEKTSEEDSSLESAVEPAKETENVPAFEPINERKEQTEIPPEEDFNTTEGTGASSADAFESVDVRIENTESFPETAETEGKDAVIENRVTSEKGWEEDVEQNSEANSEKDTENLEENSEDPEKDAEGAEESAQDPEKDAEGAEESPQDPEKDAEGAEESPRDPEKNAEGAEESAQDPEKDAEGAEESAQDPEKNAEGAEESPKDPEKETENPEEEPEDPEKETENPEEEPEVLEKDEEGTEEKPENPEKETENPEEEPEDPEKETENPEKETENPEEEPEDPEKDTEDAEEKIEDSEKEIENLEEESEDPEKDTEDTGEKPEDSEKETENLEEEPEDLEKDVEEAEENPEDLEKDGNETEENPEKNEDTTDTDGEDDFSEESGNSDGGGTEVKPEMDEELQEYRKETEESRRESNTEVPKPAFASIDEEFDQEEETGEKRDLEGGDEENPEQKEKTVEQKIEDVKDLDGVSLSYLSDLKNENAIELAAARQEFEKQKQQAVNLYSEMLDGHVSPERMAELKEEYQNLRGEIGRTGSRIDALESSGDSIGSKIDETRGAMIADGWEASRNTELAGQLADGLHDEYNEIYYDSKASEADLTDLAERNKGLIEEMTSERDRIEQAKEAKMSQIRDYVCSNDMERYDTERDPHYQSLIAEYRELEEAGKRLDYPIANLDEDTKLISDRLHIPYESVQRSERIVPLVQECGHGVDNPEKTNYFVDETKAREALEPFADQENWEQMTLEAKTEKLEALRDYIGEVFGDKEKPEIIYYHGEANSYGSYIDSSNVIKINIDNINDSSEIMDTVAHEYRHRYQSLRGQALENTRDVEYKRGLDSENYIVYDPGRGLNDFEGYKNQLVETDARAFAQSFKNKLEEMRASDRASAELKDTSAEEALKESGIVFDETDDKVGMQKVQETDESGKQSEGKETHEGNEGLTAEEIGAIKEQVAPRYENCAEIASQIESLENYKEHTELKNGHIEKVYNKSMEAADTLKEVFGENSYDGYYSPEADKRALGAMAWYHDTGMDGAVQAKDYESGKAAYTESRLEGERIRRQAVNESGEGPQLSLKPEDIKVDLEKEYDNHFRKEHQFFSAIHVLEDRDFLESQGINADEVAFGCMLHSKSGSGVKELSDTGSWDGAISRLQTRIDAYNETHDTKIHFDDTFIREKAPDGEGFVYKQKEAARVRTECACLRLGDANGHDFESGTTQAGHSLNTEFQSEFLDKNPGSNLLDQEADKSHYHTTKLKAEVQESSVQNDEQEIDKGDFKGRMYALGERNFKEIGTRAEKSEVVEYVNLVEGDHYTHATQECILERIKELQSITVPDTAAGMNRGMEKTKTRPIDHHVEINLGDVHNQETLDSYKAFKARIFRQYHVRVKVAYNDLTGKNKC